MIIFFRDHFNLRAQIWHFFPKTARMKDDNFGKFTLNIFRIFNCSPYRPLTFEAILHILFSVCCLSLEFSTLVDYYLKIAFNINVILYTAKNDLIHGD